MSSEMNDKAVCSAREEVQESRMRIEGLTYQLNALQKQVLFYTNQLLLAMASYHNQLMNILLDVFAGICLRGSYQRAGGHFGSREGQASPNC